MYEFNYFNLYAPAVWLLLISLLATGICHAVVLYLSMKIDAAVKTAQTEAQYVDVSHVALKERQQREMWVAARKACFYIAPLALLAWIVGLGRP